MPKTVFLIGAGAVENAWDPIIKAVGEATNSAVDPDICNRVFTQYVTLLRSLTTGRHMKMTNVDPAPVGEVIDMLKKAICRRLSEATLNVTPRFREFASRYSRDSSTFITTNWDDAVERCVGVPVLYLHGDFQNPRTLYLPGEGTHEIYRERAEHEELTRAEGRAIAAMCEADELIIFGLSLSPLGRSHQKS